MSCVYQVNDGYRATAVLPTVMSCWLMCTLHVSQLFSFFGAMSRAASRLESGCDDELTLRVPFNEVQALAGLLAVKEPTPSNAARR